MKSRFRIVRQVPAYIYREYDCNYAEPRFLLRDGTYTRFS